jgi:hypothetical protein
MPLDASTTLALPVLPLPRLQKRIIAASASSREPSHSVDGP